MSKTATAGLIGFAIVVLICGVAFGLRLGYSQFAAVGFGFLPAMLVLFPVIRARSGGKLTFLQWLVVVFMSLLFAVVINNLAAASLAPSGG